MTDTPTPYEPSRALVDRAARDFDRHLKHASAVVATWPVWKQKLLGGQAMTIKPHPFRPPPRKKYRPELYVPEPVKAKAESDLDALRCQIHCALGRNVLIEQESVPDGIARSDYVLFNLLQAVEDLSKQLQHSKDEK